MNERVDELEDEAATVALGAWLAKLVTTRFSGSALVFLRGNLGAGKTTLARGLLRALGHSGAVKSPTYTLMEPYALGGVDVYHFDLYRVADPQELDFVGFDETIDGTGIKLIEWPERAQNWLPSPDVTIDLTVVSGAPVPDRGVSEETDLDATVTDQRTTRRAHTQYR